MATADTSTATNPAVSLLSSLGITGTDQQGLSETDAAMAALDSSIGMAPAAPPNPADVSMVHSAYAKLFGTRQAQAGAILAAGADAATSIQQTGKLALAKDAAVSGVGKSFDYENKLASFANDILVEHDRLKGELQDIRDKQSVSIFEHPIDFIRNQIQILMIDQPKASAELQLYNLAVQGLQNLNASVQSSIKSQQDLAPTTNKLIIDADAKRAKDQANAQAAEAEAAALSAPIDLGKFNISVSAATQEAADHNALFAQRQRALTQMAQNDSDVIRSVKVGYAKLYNGQQVPFSDADILAKFRNKNAAVVNTFNVGGNSIVAGRGIYGSTPGEAIDLIDGMKAPMPEGAAPVTKMLRDTKAVFYSVSRAALGEKATKAAENESYIFRANQDAANIDPANNANIFQAPKASSVLATPYLLESNNFLKNIVAPSIAATKDDSTNPQQIFNLGVGSMNIGTADFKAVTYGISEYFKAAVDMNNKLREYDGFGLEKQQGYKTQIDGKIIDLADPTAVSAALMRRAGLKVRLDMYYPAKQTSK